MVAKSASAARGLRKPSHGVRRVLLLLCTCLAIGASTISAAQSSVPNSSPSSATSNQQPNSTSSASSTPSQQKQSIVTDSGKTVASSGKTSPQVEPVVIVAEPQQAQSTDVSSMYVQIPIADPNDTGATNDNTQQQQQTLDGKGDEAKASSWTGPWPKKFQIGYIKQSDLHQVLIESLKSNPFASLGDAGGTNSENGGSNAVPATKTAQAPAPAPSPTTAPGSTKSAAPPASPKPPSDSSSLMSPQLPVASKHLWANAGNSYGGQTRNHKQAANHLYQRGLPFRGHEHKLSGHQNPPRFVQMQQLQQHPQVHHFAANNQQQQQFSQFNIKPSGLIQMHYQQQHQPMPRPPMVSNFQQQSGGYQFASFPHASMFKNQPVYTTINGQGNNNFPQQDITSELPQVPQVQQFGGSGGQTPGAPTVLIRHQRPSATLNGDYYSSWRPVASDKDQAGSGRQAYQAGDFQQQQQQPTFNDDFEDGFNSPVSKLTDSSTMNRHPVLNNYLDSATGVKLPQSPSQAAGATKNAASAKNDAGTKGERSIKMIASAKAPESPMAQIKGGDGGGKRRVAAANGTSTTSTTSTTTTESSSVVQQTSTSFDGLQTTTTTLASTTTMGSDGTSGETTEPESESVESETSDPLGTTTTTTMTTMANNSSSELDQDRSSGKISPAESAATTSASTTTTTTAASTTATLGDDAEVVTATGSPSSTASLPPLDTAASSTPAASATLATGTTREETTPATNGNSMMDSANSQASAAAAKGVEVEGASAMSDEALLAAAVRTGADIGKASMSSSSSSSNDTGKRSSGQQQQQVSASASTTTSKRTRSSSSDRLQQARVKTSGVKFSSKSPLKRQQQPSRSAKQVNNNNKEGAKGTKNRSASATKSSQLKTSKRPQNQKNAKVKATRMAPASEKLQQQPAQIVSMSAAQAQSTAQTLASLLLARCMSSTSCLHLLDVCSTKQAMVSVPSSSGSSNGSEATLNTTNNQTGGWSMPVGLTSSGVVSLAQSLQADKVLSVLPQWREAIENLVDHGPLPSGYTLLLPSNEAMDRLPAASLAAWLTSPNDQLAQIIDNHLIDSAESIEVTSTKQAATSSRQFRAKGLQVNQHRDRMVTINGKRLVYANQLAPAGGRIHVIDGLLDWPVAGGKLLDIMDTLKQCDKFDGFVTLAEGTGLTRILKQEGPMTVFVPSNEALRKIPDEELEVIKNNSTALKEFLMYHVANGSYFSQDLRDGQQLASILEMKPIQVGVRVDGCSRRLVEANTSPMRRPDIVAKNGVIHILDWYLTTRDNEWCDPIVRPASTASASSTTASSSEVTSSPSSPTSSANVEANLDRLQQLASESSSSSLDGSSSAYATRMTMPPNHKQLTAQVGANLNQNQNQNYHHHHHHKGSLVSVLSSSSSPSSTGNLQPQPTSGSSSLQDAHLHYHHHHHHDHVETS